MNFLHLEPARSLSSPRFIYLGNYFLCAGPFYFSPARLLAYPTRPTNPFSSPTAHFFPAHVFSRPRRRTSRAASSACAHVAWALSPTKCNPSSPLYPSLFPSSLAQPTHLPFPPSLSNPLTASGHLLLPHFQHPELPPSFPDEILAVIPTDPYDQLDLARKITSMAIASRVSSLESEAAKLRKKISDKDQTIAELQDQIAALDRMFRDSEARFRIALEENAKLMKERDMLAMASKKLGKDLSKLEAFKRQLMQSLSDEKSSANSSNLQSIDNTTYDRPIARTSSWKEEESITRRASDLASISTETGDPNLEGNNKFSITPYITPRLTPSATPTASSTVASLKGLSTAGSSPKMWSGSASPTKSRFEGNYSSMSSCISNPSHNIA